MNRILVVDDDPIFTFLAQTRLASAGYTVHLAGDGVEALHLLESEQFDAALIDLVMPRIDGIRLIGLIRGMPRYRDLVVMVVTSRDVGAIRDDVLQMGVRAIHTKPVDWSHLTRDLNRELTS